MQVLIMRHGEAALDAASDAVRPLTLCGRDESRQMAAWLNTKSVDIERVLVSPYLRAEQTLDTVRAALTLPEGAEVMPALTPGGDAALVGSYLQVLAQQGEVGADRFPPAAGRLSGGGTVPGRVPADVRHLGNCQRRTGAGRPCGQAGVAGRPVSADGESLTA